MAGQIMPIATRAQHETDEQVLLNLLNIPNPTVPMLMAERQDLSEAVLSELANHRRADVRLKVLHHNGGNFPLSTVMEMLNDIHPDVRNEAANIIRQQENNQ